MKEEQKFEVGDIVEAFGVRGIVINKHFGQNYELIVEFESGVRCSFTSDGRVYLWNKEPSLKLISRAKKKEKKILKGWVNVYPFKKGLRKSDLYLDKEEADRSQSPNRIACVEMTGEFEMEVEG